MVGGFMADKAVEIGRQFIIRAAGGGSQDSIRFSYLCNVKNVRTGVRVGSDLA